MLRKETLDLTTELARSFAAEGKTAVAVADTPLELLCNHTCYNDSTVGINAEVMQVQSDNTSHNSLLETLVKQIGDKVASHIDYAKNTVNVSIKEIADYVFKNIGEYTDKFINDIKIVRDKDYSFLQNADLLKDIKAYGNVDASLYRTPDSYFSLSANTYQEKLDMLMTGHANLDMTIKQWVASLEADTVDQCWAAFFGNPKEHDYTNLNMIGQFNNAKSGVDWAILTYLWARYLLLDIKNGKQVNEDRSTYDYRVKEYLTVAAYKLNSYIQESKQAVDQNVVVRFYDLENKTVLVYNEPYLKWLDGSGTPEVLYGALVSNSKAVKATELDEQRIQLLKSWSTHQSALNVRHRNEYLNNYIKVLRNGFILSLNDLTEEEQAYFDAHPGAKQDVIERFEKELKDVTLEDRKDHYRTVIKVVCKARYHYTDVYEFLKVVDELSQDESITLEQALTTATMQYITDYVASQIKLV